MSIAHITTREHGDFLSGKPLETIDVQGLDIIGPTPHWVCQSGELAPSLTCGCTWESRPYTSPRQHYGAGPSGRCVGQLALKT